MEKTKVEIVELRRCRAVSAYGFGEHPEDNAQSILSGFIAKQGWSAEDLSQHRVFGFNNPDPSPGSPAYGYEFLVTVDDSFELPADVPEGIELKTMPGGLYVSLRSKGIPNPVKWGGVVKWLNGSGYQYDSARQWLEELLLNEPGIKSLTGGQADPEMFEFHLMSPIVPASERVR